MKILTEIINSKKKEVKAIKEKYSYKDFESSSLFSQKKRSLTKALTPDKFGIIAEMKRKSPSAGLINTSFDIIQQGKIYEGSGAVAISCLTDYYYFGGYNNDLTLLKSATTIPLLRKEFIIDEIQLFESKAIGADAILLIAEILTKEQALHLTTMAQSIGMEVLM
jgi:indole-3-glycerol phosphate synthase